MATKQCPYCAETIQAEAIVCRYCGRQLVDGVDVPPPVGSHAGAARDTGPYTVIEEKPQKKGGGCLPILLIIGGLVVAYILLVALVNAVGPSSSASSAKPTATPNIAALRANVQPNLLPYDSLARNTEQHIGRVVRYTGQVVQVSEGRVGRVVLRVNVTEGDYGIWDDTVWVNAPATPRVLEDDIIDLIGIVEGRRSYESIFGQTITIPEITAYDIMLN